MAGRRNLEPFFDAWGDVCIRKDITDEDDDDWDPAEPGPDIGTSSNPICRFRDQEGGNLLGITATLTREGAVNGAIIHGDPARRRRAGRQLDAAVLHRRPGR